MKKFKFFLSFTLILAGFFLLTPDANSYYKCTGTQVTTDCYDTETWGETGSFRGRVCDNDKCARARFDAYDGTATCTYCNDESGVGGL